VTDPRGNLEGADPSKFTSGYTYDTAGRLDTSRDPRGNLTDQDYDPAGNLTSVKDAKLEIKPVGSPKKAFESPTWANAGQGDGYVVILGL